MLPTAVAKVVPDTGIHLPAEFSCEVGNRFSVWFNVACLGDMLLNVAHFMQERIKQFLSR